MQSGLTPRHLSSCEQFYNKFLDIKNRLLKSGLSPTHEQFYNKFPDLAVRTAKFGLSPTHYVELAKRDLTGEVKFLCYVNSL